MSIRTMAGAVAILLAALISAPPASQAQTKARTPLEAVDLTTPEAAATSFIEAYASSDYFSVYYMLSPLAKRGFIMLFNGTGYERLLSGAPRAHLPESVVGKRAPRDLFDDIILDGGTLMDDMMVAAEARDMLPFVFGPQTAIGESHGEAQAARVRIENSEPAGLELELIRLSDGQWRIDRVRFAGSDTDYRPWGVPLPGE